MKRITLTSLVLVTLIMSVKPLRAQKITDGKYDKAVVNLIIGINSENRGLEKSSIYYAGRDRVTEAVDALIERLNNEDDPSTRILIALSLYEIRDRRGFNAIKELSTKDKNERVRSISGLIYNEYAKSTDLKFVTVNHERPDK